MSIDIEYAIKKDVRNNPIVREVDARQKREFLRTACLVGVVVALVLFSAWQHFRMVRTGYDLQGLEQSRTAEESVNRKLRLEVETLRAPQRIEQLAMQDLHMTAPAQKDTLIIERAVPATIGDAQKAMIAAVR